MPVISQAIDELYASGGDGVHLLTVELSHPQLAAPVRLVANSDADMNLPLTVGGTLFAHTACAFQITMPGFDGDGPTDARAKIDNVSHLLYEPLNTVRGTNQPILVTIRTYIVQPPSMTPVLEDIMSGLELRAVQLTESTAEGVLLAPDGKTRNFPAGENAFFDYNNYPGIFQ